MSHPFKDENLLCKLLFIAFFCFKAAEYSSPEIILNGPLGLGAFFGYPSQFQIEKEPSKGCVSSFKILGGASSGFASVLIPASKASVLSISVVKALLIELVSIPA